MKTANDYRIEILDSLDAAEISLDSLYINGLIKACVLLEEKDKEIKRLKNHLSDRNSELQAKSLDWV